MPVPSRRMPRHVVPPLGTGRKSVLIVVGALVAFGLASMSWKALLGIGIYLAVAALWGVRATRRHAGRMRNLIAERPGESICRFARDFDCRQIDTWVVRAVYEELQDCVSARVGPVPIRAQDHLSTGLGIDPDDIENVAHAIAVRAARSLEGVRANPYWNRVETARDLVMFFDAQPKAA